MDEKKTKQKELDLSDRKESSQRSKRNQSKDKSKNLHEQINPKDGELKGKNQSSGRKKNNQRRQKDSEDKRKSNNDVKFYTINGRNGLTLDHYQVNDVELSVLDIDLDISELLKQPTGSEKFLSSDFCSGLDSVVRAYATARGYSTTSSGKIVAEALRLSIRAFSLLCAIYRTQACGNIVAQNNLPISQLFTRKSTQSVNNSLYSLLADPVPSPSMLNEKISISNAVWMQDYVSHLSKMYLPKTLTDVLAYLYKNVFTAEAGRGLGTNSLILLWPYSGNTTINSAYSATITALNTLYATYPDLEILLKICGFGPESAMAYDFTRPLAANELSIVYDPEVPRLLENIGALDCGYIPFSAANYKSYYEYEAINSVFAFDQMRTIETSHNLLYWMLNFAALSNLNVTLYPSAGNLLQVNGGIKILQGNTIYERVFLPDNIQYFFVGWTTLAEAYQVQLQTIMYNLGLSKTRTAGVTGLHSRNSICARITVSVEDNELSFAITLESNYMLDGPNNYAFDINEASVIMQNALPTLIYGQEWRTKLQLVYLNMANEVSGIKY